MSLVSIAAFACSWNKQYMLSYLLPNKRGYSNDANTMCKFKRIFQTTTHLLACPGVEELCINKDIAKATDWTIVCPCFWIQIRTWGTDRLGGRGEEKNMLSILLQSNVSVSVFQHFILSGGDGERQKLFFPSPTPLLICMSIRNFPLTSLNIWVISSFFPLFLRLLSAICHLL